MGFGLLLVPTGTAYAATIVVPPGVSGDEFAWDLAFCAPGTEFVINYNMELSSDFLEVYSDVVLSGTGTITVKGNFRHILVRDGKNLTINNLTLEGDGVGGGITTAGNNHVILNGVTVDKCINQFDGGAVYAGYDSVFDITGSTFTANKAVDGGAIFANMATLNIDSSNLLGNLTTDLGGGAAIFARESVTNIRNDTVIKGNSHDKEGKGTVMIKAGTLTVADSFFTENIGDPIASDVENSANPRATVSVEDTVIDNNAGTGISLNSTDAEITSVEITENTAMFGGGSFIGKGSNVVFSDCLISKNSVDADGGGLWIGGGSSVQIKNNTVISKNTANWEGGGISIWKTDNNTGNALSMEGSDVLENSAVRGGGGIYAQDIELDLTSCGISENSVSGTVEGGGGIYATNTLVRLNAVTMDGNNAASKNGGAIYAMNGSDVQVYGLSAFSNNAALNGGAIYSAADKVLLDSTNGGISFEANTATEEGGAIWVNPCSNVKAVHMLPPSFTSFESSGIVPTFKGNTARSKVVPPADGHEASLHEFFTNYDINHVGISTPTPMSDSSPRPLAETGDAGPLALLYISCALSCLGVCVLASRKIAGGVNGIRSRK